MKDNKKSSKGRNFLVQGTILAAASIIAKIIGMIYRIPNGQYFRGISETAITLRPTRFITLFLFISSFQPSVSRIETGF